MCKGKKYMSKTHARKNMGEWTPLHAYRPEAHKLLIYKFIYNCMFKNILEVSHPIGTTYSSNDILFLTCIC
jgi:hypothetical protein